MLALAVSIYFIRAFWWALGILVAGFGWLIFKGKLDRGFKPALVGLSVLCGMAAGVACNLFWLPAWVLNHIGPASYLRLYG
jgi:hypothetical protein